MEGRKGRVAEEGNGGEEWRRGMEGRKGGEERRRGTEERNGGEERRRGMEGRKGRVAEAGKLVGEQKLLQDHRRPDSTHRAFSLSSCSYISRLISVRLSTQIKSPGAPLKLSEIDKKDLGREADVRLTSVVYIWQQPAVI